MSKKDKTIVPLACLSRGKRRHAKDKSLSINQTDIHFVYDRSASMGTSEMRDNAPKGLRDFVNEQKEINKKNNTKCNITITTFSDEASVMPNFDNIDVREAPEILDEYIEPEGLTRLIDTIYESIESQEKRCLDSDIPLDEWTRILVVMTDGEDNRSKKYSVTQLHDRIEKLQSENVTCLFLAANQDSIISGKQFGFSPHQSLTYSAKGAPNALRCVSQTVCAAQLSCGHNVPSFTPLQRNQSSGVDDKISTLDDDAEFSEDEKNSMENLKLQLPLPPPVAAPLLHRMNTGDYSKINSIIGNSSNTNTNHVTFANDIPPPRLQLRRQSATPEKY